MVLFPTLTVATTRASEVGTLNTWLLHLALLSARGTVATAVNTVGHWTHESRGSRIRIMAQ
jgi:hypothetical protein